MITALRFAPRLVSLVLAISSVQAQSPPPINPVPLGSPIPRILPPPPLTVRPGAIAPPPSAPGSALLNRTVKVAGVTVDGVTAYTTAEIVPLVTGLTGPGVPLSRIEAAREVILERYRADGYVFTAVSAHIDAAGRLRFLVTEGHIVSVRLDGDIGPAGVQVLRFLKRLTEEPVIDAATLERYLLLAQDVPGVTLHAVLEPAAGQPGALDLVAQVERSPVSGLVVQGDKALAATTELQLNTSIGISVLGKSAQIPAQWYGFFTPPSVVSIRQQWRSRTPPSQTTAVPVQVMCSVLTKRQIHGPSFPFCMDWNTKSPQWYALAVPSDLLCST